MRMFKTIAFALIVVSSTTSFSNSNINDSLVLNQNLADQDLKDQILEVMNKTQHRTGYKQAKKELLGNMALHEDNNGYFITDVYCERDYNSPGPNKTPNSNVINVEHTWPQSKFGGSYRDLQKSDLHHLYPTDSNLNSSRGNHPFGIVTSDERNLKCSISKLGRDARGRFVFEPPNAHKGNVARAIFYFSVRYRLKLDPGQESVLRVWHVQDPVDADEQLRNDQVENYQGNRNPFIDQPELANLISDF